MKLIILPYSATPNPLGFPGDYPAERRLVDDAAEVPAGWIVVTEEEYRTRIDTHYAAVAAINEAAKATEETDERNRLTAFKQLLQDGRAIDQNWASATNAQKIELGRISFRILWMARTSLAELVKPEAA